MRSNKSLNFGLQLIFGCLFFCTSSAAQTDNCKLSVNIINGVYNGKNLFFQNDEAFGIRKIYVNGKLASDKAGARFELDLSGLKLGQKVTVKVEFCEKSPQPYKLLNPEAIKDEGKKKYVKSPGK